MLGWVILIIFIWFIYKNKKEGLNNRPKPHQIEGYARSLMSKRMDITAPNARLLNIKRKIPFMDPVLYEQLRGLNKNGKYNNEEIKKLMS